MHTSSSIPVVEELATCLKPHELFPFLARLPYCLFLDSGVYCDRRGRYSFLAVDPFDFIEIPTFSYVDTQKNALKVARHSSRQTEITSPLKILAEKLSQYRTATIPGLPPFQGGLAGLFSYELGRYLEHIPAPRYDEFCLPSLAIGLYDVVIAFDHQSDRAWIISQGFPETQLSSRQQRAHHRITQIKQFICDIIDQKQPPNCEVFSDTFCQAQRFVKVSTLSPELLAPQYAVDNHLHITSNFTKAGYLKAVEQVINYILEGDVFQVNLSQRLLTPAMSDSVSLFQRLRTYSPAPMAAYFDLGNYQIVSASPERFLQVYNGHVESRPIKGTRPRTGNDSIDRSSEADLLASEKDRAENIMIVDLLRNDLSRVCRPESVCVEQLCTLERYQQVIHLVSVITGHLRDECTPIELIEAAFPGGSITGAPKIRAMEIIAELEPTARGAYCGSLGYIGFDGTMDLSILIRTITAGRGWWQFPVGGGIVVDSNPQMEYNETWHKAEGLVKTINSFHADIRHTITT